MCGFGGLASFTSHDTLLEPSVLENVLSLYFYLVDIIPLCA